MSYPLGRYICKEVIPPEKWRANYLGSWKCLEICGTMDYDGSGSKTFSFSMSGMDPDTSNPSYAWYNIDLCTNFTSTVFMSLSDVWFMVDGNCEVEISLFVGDARNTSVRSIDLYNFAGGCKLGQLLKIEVPDMENVVVPGGEGSGNGRNIVCKISVHKYVQDMLKIVMHGLTRFNDTPFVV